MPESNCSGPAVTWTLCGPSPQCQVTACPLAMVAPVGPKALLAMVTSAARAAPGTARTAPAARCGREADREDELAADAEARGERARAAATRHDQRAQEVEERL